jgi:hypothetical protein
MAMFIFAADLPDQAQRCAYELCWSVAVRHETTEWSQM